MNADGTNQTNLTKHPAHDTHPNWGPDGTIAFQSNRSNSGTGDVNIWVMDADGSNLHQRTTDPLDDTHPMWSPDGTMMAFARRESETSPADIWVMNADGTNETQITSDPGDEQHADWSPCGTSIAFRSNKADNYDIWVVYLDDLAQNQITTYTGDDRNPDWSPDGTMMAFRSDRSDNNDIWIYYFPITVNIDIKPGSDPNCFNINGHGVIPVAILGSDAFDVSTIDLYEPLRFAGLSVRAKGNSQLQCSFDDVSGDFTNPKGEPDGFPDLVCHFADDTDLWTSGNGTATLTGTLTDCTSFEGADEICVVP
jgi:Tol biopolymer transport system component